MPDSRSLYRDATCIVWCHAFYAMHTCTWQSLIYTHEQSLQQPQTGGRAGGTPVRPSHEQHLLPRRQSRPAQLTSRQVLLLLLLLLLLLHLHLFLCRNGHGCTCNCNCLCPPPAPMRLLQVSVRRILHPLTHAVRIQHARILALDTIRKLRIRWRTLTTEQICTNQKDTFRARNMHHRIAHLLSHQTDTASRCPPEQVEVVPSGVGSGVTAGRHGDGSRDGEIGVVGNRHDSWPVHDRG